MPGDDMDPIPGLEENHRRALDGNEPNDRSAWHTAASFAVVFSQRQVDGQWERRLEAEQTEVEPELAEHPAA